MGGMCKCLIHVSRTYCAPTQHLRVLNAHLECILEHMTQEPDERVVVMDAAAAASCCSFSTITNKNNEKT
eukprot:4161739-Amphidinium_carterae.1